MENMNGAEIHIIDSTGKELVEGGEKLAKT